jgi:hypothetical protein
MVSRRGDKTVVEQLEHALQSRPVQTLCDPFNLISKAKFIM